MASNYAMPRDDRLEKQAELRGAIQQLIWIQTGGLDGLATELLGSPQDLNYAPIEPYMAEEPSAEESL